jgi:DNA-binding beta-propeller fold protein YncE
MRPGIVCALALLAAAPGAAQGWYPHEGAPLQYRVRIRFGEEPDTMPAGWKFGRVAAVATDRAAAEVYVFQRGKMADPIIVFDKTGKYLRSWGKGMFANPHGLRVDRDNNVWVTDTANQQVMKFDKTGKVLLTLGTKGQAGTGEKTFNRPTDIAFARDGGFYISDGYGNSRVLRFASDGTYLSQWGKPGGGPGEFRLPHAIATDSKGRVYVVDRENNRIQVFTENGEFLKQWNHLGAAQGIFITPDDQLWLITYRDYIEILTYDTLSGRIMHVDLESGKILGSMESPGHMIDVASDGQIYIASLTGNVFQWYPGWTTRGISGGWQANPPKK